MIYRIRYYSVLFGAFNYSFTFLNASDRGCSKNIKNYYVLSTSIEPFMEKRE